MEEGGVEARADAGNQHLTNDEQDYVRNKISSQPKRKGWTVRDARSANF